MSVAVVTTVYNRKDLMKRLYNSLLSQSNKDFEWYIVNDGSTDNLEELIDEIKKENKIKVIYIYQENGGKHRALNKAMSVIKNELTIIVDSDDYLTEDAIETINKYYEKYKDDNDICGFCFLRAFSDGKINGPKFKEDEYKADYYTCRINENVGGDKAEVVFTKCLKEYPFLEVPGEKFLSERYLWGKLGLKYKMIYINKVIYNGDYLEDGLAKNHLRKKYESPIGFIETQKILCNKRVKFSKRLWPMIYYIAYSKIAKRSFKYQYNDVEFKFLFLALYLPGLFYKHLVENKMKKTK